MRKTISLFFILSRSLSSSGLNIRLARAAQSPDPLLQKMFVRMLGQDIIRTKPESLYMPAVLGVFEQHQNLRIGRKKPDPFHTPPRIAFPDRTAEQNDIENSSRLLCDRVPPTSALDADIEPKNLTQSGLQAFPVKVVWRYDRNVHVRNSLHFFDAAVSILPSPLENESWGFLHFTQGETLGLHPKGIRRMMTHTGKDLVISSRITNRCISSGFHH